MYLKLFGFLFALWLLGFLVFHVVGALIHLLLLVAIISLVAYFVRQRAVTGA